MEACYDSLSRYVNTMRQKEVKEFCVQVNYYFQTISVQTLMPLIEHFLGIPDEDLTPEQLKEQIFKKRKDVKLILGRVKEFLKDDFIKTNYKIGNIYVVFSKKNALKSFEKILKKDLHYSEEFFKDMSRSGKVENPQLYFYYQKRKELAQDKDSPNSKLIGLIRDYLRSIDLNYIDASKSYFKERFTLKDLLKRDKINKKFTKVSHIRMDTDGGPSYSAELAADYIIHKMEEMNENITLQVEENHSSKNSANITPAFSLNQSPIGHQKHGRPRHRESVEGIEFEMNRKSNAGRFTSSDEIIDEIESMTCEAGDSELVKFISIITCENRIRLKYFHSLTTALARSKAQFESRFISPFDITMKFGLEALEKNVAYQFIEKYLAEMNNLNLKIEATEDDIRILTPDDTTGSSFGFSFIDNGAPRPSLTKRGSIILPTTAQATMCKVTPVNTFEDVCNYMKTSKEIVDFTTLGIDRRNFKQALHMILKLVAAVDLVEAKHHKHIRQERSG